MNKSSKPNVKDVVSLIEKMGISEDRLKEIITEYTEKQNEQTKIDTKEDKVEVKKQEPAKTRKPKKQYKENTSKTKEKTEKKSENKLPEIYAGFATTKMQKIRQNYTKLYLGNNNVQMQDDKKETEKNEKIIERTIEDLKVLNKRYVGSFGEEKYRLTRKITDEAEIIQKFLPTINSMETLAELVAQLPRNSKSFRIDTVRSNVSTKLNSLKIKNIQAIKKVVIPKNIVAVATAIAS